MLNVHLHYQLLAALYQKEVGLPEIRKIFQILQVQPQFLEHPNTKCNNVTSQITAIM